jgi:hypothetical protein
MAAKKVPQGLKPRERTGKEFSEIVPVHMNSSKSQNAIKVSLPPVAKNSFEGCMTML